MEEREFLGRIEQLGGLPSREEADRWAMTVLLALIHLLPDRHKRRRLITQLPGTVKARLLAEPPGAFLMDLDTFLQHVAAGLGSHAMASLAGRTVIVVDDGLATGATMRAAVRAVRKQQPARLVVAVPVGSREACAALGEEADEVVCLDQPVPFFAVGAFYEHFEPTENAEVERILEQWQAARREAATRAPDMASASRPG